MSNNVKSNMKYLPRPIEESMYGKTIEIIRPIPHQSMIDVLDDEDEIKYRKSIGHTDTYKIDEEGNREYDDCSCYECWVHDINTLHKAIELLGDAMLHVKQMSRDKDET